MNILQNITRLLRFALTPERLSRIGDISTYENYKLAFLRNATSSGEVTYEARLKLVEQFEAVDKNVTSATTPTDGLIMAEALISLGKDIPGEIVECGCFAGASTCKLSLIAELMGKTLFVLDSFEGLPEVDDWNRHDIHSRRSTGWVKPWLGGRYSVGYDMVVRNLVTYGSSSVCTLVKGWFSEQFFNENLPDKISFAFVDVDIPSSAKDCLVSIWPRLSDGGIFFSHDVAYIKVLQTLHDKNLWNDILEDFPPVLFGAGFGYGEHSPHLGFMVKGNRSAEYIKGLMLDK